MASSSRWAFRRFFARKTVERWHGILGPSSRLRSTDPALIASLAAEYRELATHGAPRTHPIPRHIFMVWQQGWAAAPRIVRASAESWRNHNPGWELHQLDGATIAGHMKPEFRIDAPAATPTARTALDSLAVLRTNGGVWVDATVFCTRGLDDWLPATAGSGLFMFSRPQPWRWLDTWFIAAAAESPVIAGWHQMAARYWQLFAKPHGEHWLAHLFEHLAHRDPDIYAAWNAVPKLSARGPLAVAGVAFDRRAPQAIFDLIDENRLPVHKLTHVWKPRERLAQTPLGALTGLDRL